MFTTDTWPISNKYLAMLCLSYIIEEFCTTDFTDIVHAHFYTRELHHLVHILCSHQ